MTALIPVTDRIINESLIPTVDGRELHAFLGNKDHFATWITDRIRQFDFMRDIEFVCFSEDSEKGRPQLHYALSLDMAKQLAMVERNEKGKEARLYFIECEKRLFRPQSHLETAKQLVASLEHAERLQLQLTEQAPMVEAYEDLMDSDGAISMGRAGKILGIGEKTVFRRLRDMGILMTGNIPYQEFAHHFKVIIKSWGKEDSRVPYTQTLVTPKGLDYLRKRLKGVRG
jgi:anti-repressor protein